MTTDTDLLEQIVAGVMQQLTSMSGEVRNDSAGTTEHTNGKTTANELLLDENVITAELLSKRLSGLGSGPLGWLGSNEVSPQTAGLQGVAPLDSSGAVRLSIGFKSVLTPSARDWLRECNLVWGRQTQNRSTGDATKGGWKIIIERSTPAVAAAIEDGVVSTGHRPETADDFSVAVRSAVSAVCRAEADGVVLFTDKPAVAACLANRNRKVRAATAMGKACVRAARRQMGANLLCVDPTGRTVWELKTILRELKQGGRPTPPGGWQECGLQ